MGYALAQDLTWSVHPCSDDLYFIFGQALGSQQHTFSCSKSETLQEREHGSLDVFSRLLELGFD